MAGPLISVVIPARNAAATLGQTLASLRAQTEPDWEAIIIDDGSTDGTAAIIAEAVAHDPRLRALAGAGQGVGAARNLGIYAARGKYLHFLDADDWNDPAFYAKLLAPLVARPDAVAAFCGYRRVMPGGVLTATYCKLQHPEDPFEDFVRGCLVAIHAVLVEREIILQIGGFDPDLRNGEDWDLWQRVSRFGRPWVKLDEGLAFYRTESPSLSRNVQWFAANSRTIITRGFGRDERLAGLATKHEAGGSPAFGSMAQAMAYNALWTLGMDVGAGGRGDVDAEMLLPYGAAGKEALVMAEVIFEGLLAGSRSLPHQVAGRWADFGATLTGRIAWLGELWNNPYAARAIQYHLEERVLFVDELGAARRLALTQSVYVEISAPAETVPAPGVDRLHARYMDCGEMISCETLAALGSLSAAQWQRKRALAAVSFRRWRKTNGLRADLFVARHAAALLRRQPGALLRRERLRGLAHKAIRRARLSTLKPLEAPPGSHAAALQAVRAWAAEHARRQGDADACAATVQRAEYDVDAAHRQDHFEGIFKTEDPWNYGSPYEQQKYQRQCDILPPGRIGNALELACAEGHFTMLLAPRVEHLTATDISATALRRTEARCAGMENIDYWVLDLAAGPIPGEMDLILCSEVLYYLSGEAELRLVAEKIAAALAPEGVLVTAHAYVLKDNLARTGFDWGTIYGGAEVINRVFASTPGLVLERSIDTELYRIDRFRRAAPPAQAPVVEHLSIVETLDRDVARYVVWGGATMLRRHAMESEHRTHIPVLMYHGVSEDGPAGLARYQVRPAQFKAQLRWLRANGYHTIGAEGLAWHIDTGTPFAGRPLMLTFDDGLQDFAETAWPLLVAHDFTAEMYVVTDLVGGHAVWDADLGPPAPLMDAATITRLAAEGTLFGSHLATHRPVDGLSSLELARELAGSHAMLARWLGRAPVSFAAPYGITDHRLSALAAEFGYRIGFGGGQGAVRLGEGDRLDLPRIEVPGDWDLATFIRCMESWL